MAERIEQFPAVPGVKRRVYPWDEWTDGNVWKLHSGVDFDAEVDQFRNRLYTVASRKGLMVRTTKGVEDDGTETLVFQFFGEPDPAL